MKVRRALGRPFRGTWMWDEWNMVARDGKGCPGVFCGCCYWLPVISSSTGTWKYVHRKIKCKRRNSMFMEHWLFSISIVTWVLCDDSSLEWNPICKDLGIHEHTTTSFATYSQKLFSTLPLSYAEQEAKHRVADSVLLLLELRDISQRTCSQCSAKRYL